MSQTIKSDVDHLIKVNLLEKFNPDTIRRHAQCFKRKGMLIIPNVVPNEIRDATKRQVMALLQGHAERRDLRLATTGNTPRRMSVVTSETIAQSGGIIRDVYRSEVLKQFLQMIAGEPILPCPSPDEEFLITRQEKVGDTHGWHWGDYTFALIWIIETPPIDYGGMLQCVPHTRWNKSAPRINEFICDNPIDTYGFVSGDIYFLRTDTTLHRTVPLNRDATRIILNMTWGSVQDQAKELKGDDRWWEDPNASAATQETKSAPGTTNA